MDLWDSSGRLCGCACSQVAQVAPPSEYFALTFEAKPLPIGAGAWTGYFTPEVFLLSTHP